MLYLWIFLLIVGFALLVKGADWFVEGAAGIAKKCKVPALVIGLTVVAFGTSAPELAVSVASAIRRSTDISLGNVFGSNIVNILLILGFSSLIHTLPVRRESIVLDLPFLLIASALAVGLGAWGRALSWWDGLTLLAVFALYLTLLFRRARKDRSASEAAEAEMAERDPPKGKLARKFYEWEQRLAFLIVLTVIGLGMVVGGGTLLVEGARYIARALGAGEDIIGLTVVAIGTSLPELVTSVVAAHKGETDIAVGNIVGSNIFNIFMVAGIASLFYPLTFNYGSNLVDALVALGAAVLLFALALLFRRKLGKIAGAVMLLSFLGYYVYLFVVRL